MDITPFIDYMLDTIEKCMLTSLKEENELSEKQKLLLSKMQKRGIGAEIALENAASILKVSVQEAEQLLDELVAMEYLETTQREQKNIYILK
jgi:Fic family protein